MSATPQPKQCESVPPQYGNGGLLTLREYTKNPAVIVSHDEIWAFSRYTDIV